MKRWLIGFSANVVVLTLCMATVYGGDTDLAKKSQIKTILQRGELRVGFESGHNPFAMTNQRGEFDGFDIDFGMHLAKAMGVKFVPVNTAWEGLIPALISSSVDVIMSRMVITPQRNLKVAFSDPYMVIGQVILLKKSHAGKVNSYKDLDDSKYTVTSRMGSTGEQTVRRMIPNATYKGFKTEAEAGMEVVRGKADALVYDLPFIEVFHSSHGKDKVVVLDQTLTYEPLAWAINQGDPDFLNFLNHFLRQCKGDGFYEKVSKKWMIGLD